MLPCGRLAGRGFAADAAFVEPTATVRIQQILPVEMKVTGSPLSPSLSDVNHFGRIKQQVRWTRSLDLADGQIAGDSATISLTVSKAEGKFKPPAQNIETSTDFLDLPAGFTLPLA